jgi:beta-glucosidase
VKDAQIAAVMSAYNRIRGTYATENRHTLTDILRKEWGFEGYVQSDFWSCRSCAGSLNGGMDHEMPDAKWLNADNVRNALNDTSLEIATVDRALVRRFTQMFRFGQFERPYAPIAIDTARNGERSRRIGEQCAVLLKNDGAVLPLDAATAGRVLIVGQKEFVEDACLGGGGSSKVDPLYTVPPLDGLQDVLAGLGSDAVVERFTVDRDLANLGEAVAAAGRADTVVIMAGVVATEGADRPSIAMAERQDDLVAALLGIVERTVVVLKDSSPVLMPWIDRAPAVLEVWNQGAEDGHVVADLLFGVVNPSGKLPTTYPRSAEDTLQAGHPERYPGVDLGDGFPTITYSEGREVGYRWHQAQDVEPLFCFGFGLSYTTFAVTDVAVTGATDGVGPLVVAATVTNTGGRPGAEVVQVYLGVPAAGQPPKRLVGFAKVFLEPGESRRVTVVVDPAATHHPLSVWSLEHRAFVVPRGDFTVHVGTSSASDVHVARVSIG